MTQFKDGQFEVEMILDSIAQGVRLSTLRLKYPRFIHSEFLTHRKFSRNAASSRAIPVKTTLKRVWNDPAMPIHWGKVQRGMQAKQELTGVRLQVAKILWKAASKLACLFAWGMMKAGLHKQVANRILEPFVLIEVIVSATEFQNFLNLRNHADAQPEFQVLAFGVQQVLDQSTPNELKPGEYHLPYILESEHHFSLEDKIKISIARIARVSYNTFDGCLSKPESDKNLYEKLIGSDPKHLSPTEGVAFVTLFKDQFIPSNFDYPWQQYRKLVE